MLVLALNPGHDGAVAAVRDRELLFSFESEKDSFPRHSVVTPASVIQALQYLDEIPDVIALGGWYKRYPEGMRPRGPATTAGSRRSSSRRDCSARMRRSTARPMSGSTS